MVLLFIILHTVILTFKSVDETLVCDHSEETAIQQYFHMVPFIMLYKKLFKVDCTFR